MRMRIQDSDCNKNFAYERGLSIKMKIIRERKKFNQIPYGSSQKSNFHNKKFKTKKATPLVLILFLGYFTAVFGKFYELSPCILHFTVPVRTYSLKMGFTKFH